MKKAHKWKTHRILVWQAVFAIDKSSRSSKRVELEIFGGGVAEGKANRMPACTFRLLLAQYARKSRFQWLNIDGTNELNMHACHAQLNMHPIHRWPSSISQPLGHLAGALRVHQSNSPSIYPSIYLCVSVQFILN